MEKPAAILRNSKKLSQYLADKLANKHQVTVTIDYSCIDKELQRDMATLRSRPYEGFVNMQGTEAMIAEFENVNPSVKAKLEEQFLSVRKLKPKSGALFNRRMFNSAAFNEAPTLRNGKDALDYFAEFQQVMFPKGFRSKNDSYDVMHISIHYLFSRDIFLTRNWHDFRADKLQEKFSDLVILTPQQLINVLNGAMRIFESGI